MLIEFCESNFTFLKQLRPVLVVSGNNCYMLVEAVGIIDKQTVYKH